MHVMVAGLRGFPNVQGGVETHSEHLYPRLVELGANVTVLVRSPYQESESDWQGVQFKRLWCPKKQSLEAIIHTGLCVLYAGLKRPDVLHIHAVGPAIMAPLARLLGIKVVVTHHGPDYDREKWGALAKFILRLGERFGMRFANRRIVISEVIKQLVLDNHNKSSDLIPNGVVLPRLGGATNYIAEQSLSAGKYILLVSRFVPEKRHLDLIRAFREAQLDGWKLVLAGNADHAGEYESKVFNEIGSDPNIVCTGFVSGEDLRQLYAHAGVFVLPSSHEGLPIALLEALSFGLPCVASDIPANLCVGLSEQHYFPLGSVQKLAQRLRYFSERPNQEDKDEIREWVRVNYDWDSIAKQTSDVYQLTVANANA